MNNKNTLQYFNNSRWIIKIPATYSVVTNIDKEHLDFYKKFNILQKFFRIFVEKTSSLGKSIICKDDYYNKVNKSS